MLRIIVLTFGLITLFGLNKWLGDWFSGLITLFELNQWLGDWFSAKVTV